MRCILSLNLLLFCGTQAGAQGLAIINVEEPPLQRADQPVSDEAATQVVPPADGGLGSTMTIEQQGAKFSVRKREKPKVIVLRPAGETTPALKHRLWLPNTAMQPGSADLHFGRALLMWKSFPADFRLKVTQWSDGEETPDAEEREKAIKALSNVYTELHLLATSEDVLWDHRLRDIEGPHLYSYLLPEVQESRALARLLRLRIQHQLSQQDVSGAVDTLRDGFRLAAFIGQGETLVQQLVGIAIQGVMLEQVEQLMQLPDSPNMYWALATLPRPLTDIRESIEFELGSIHRIIPALKEAETEDHDEEYWNAVWAEVVDDLEAVGGLDQDDKLAFAVLGVVATDPAKKRLLAAGMSPDEVEAMPGMRIVLLDASREIQRVADDLAKASFLPGALGTDIGSQAQDDLQSWLRENTFKSGAAAIVGLLFPAVQAASAASVRQEFVINRLMTIEALRMHAAAHGGELPRSLNQLGPVPALPNPFSGEPFAYQVRRQGNKTLATLAADVPRPSEHLKQITVQFEKP